MQLRNCYWLIRHGQSFANTQHVIVSSLENGAKAEYGLTDLGKKQALTAGSGPGRVVLKQRIEKEKPGKVLFYTSPFSRAVQTARLASRAFSLPESDLRVEAALRERYFGMDVELQSDQNYARIWARDVKALDYHDVTGIESMRDLRNRLESLLKGLEEAHCADHLVLVAHGAVIAVLQVLLGDKELTSFRSYRTQNCEIRSFSPSDETIPKSVP